MILFQILPFESGISFRAPSHPRVTLPIARAVVVYGRLGLKYGLFDDSKRIPIIMTIDVREFPREFKFPACHCQGEVHGFGTKKENWTAWTAKPPVDYVRVRLHAIDANAKN
jgi:hypothetical protein